jgi:predicted permease
MLALRLAAAGADLMHAAPAAALAAGGVKVSRRMQWAATAIACLVKLVVVPLINVVLLRTAGFSTLAPTGDSVYQFLMLVQGAVPGAVALLIVCSRVYPDVRPLSQMLFWQYVLSLFTLPAFMVWFLSMLGL